ncbi:arylamine N-acetyltransferase [Paenibacillus sp. sgz500958]|uniref:arylamine N-acetyltransferase n=1 Tax=Paenibacillus sp. sgz500958 TaxID=3242475 RepID=UPI0036D24EB5
MDIDYPSLEYLQRLVKSRITKLAFENISKLFYLKHFDRNQFYLPPADVYIDHMYRFDFSGVCHTGNYYFYKLLLELGFDAYPIKYASHLATIVRISDQLYYTDVAMGHPTYLPADITSTTEINIDQSVLKLYPDPNKKFRFHVEHGISGKEQYHWVFRPHESIGLQEVEKLINWSNEPQRLFTTLLRVHLWQPEQHRSLSLFNNSFTIRYDEGKEQYKLHSVQEIQDILDGEFGFPNLPVHEAVDTLESLGTTIFGAP